uniref:Uncharacterized protein n=1 Tax=Parascaris univalens TaxID=6257 RepID=A0A915A903_PARUN
ADLSLKIITLQRCQAIAELRIILEPHERIWDEPTRRLIKFG